MRLLENVAPLPPPAPSRNDWGDLLARIAVGDADGLAALYDAASPYVNGLALRILGDREAAEEVVVDVFTQVWRQASRYDPTRGRPATWLLRITRSRAIDRLRQLGRHQGSMEPDQDEIDSADPSCGPAETVAAAYAHATVRTELSRLSTPERHVIELAYYRGLSQSEIAAELEVPLGTVKTRTRLAMARLRKALRGREETLL